MAKKELSDQERLFAHEYVIELDIQQAALNAGYSKNVAEKKAAGWLVKGGNYYKPDLGEFVDKLLAKRTNKLEIKAENVLSEIAMVARSSLSDVVDFDGTTLKVKSFAEIPEHAKAAIKEIKQTKDGFEIKLHDKKGMLELLGKHLNLFTDNINLNANINQNITHKYIVVPAFNNANDTSKN